MRDVSPDTVIELAQARNAAQRWKWTAGITSAAAALAVALFIANPGAAPVNDEQDAPQIALAEASPLMASIPIADTDLRIGVTYLPASEEMLISASGLTADGVHDHELWLVPGDGGDLQSLGVVVPGQERRVPISSEITRNIADGAKLVLTREPLGGKPADENAGPVVAEGALSTV